MKIDIALNKEIKQRYGKLVLRQLYQVELYEK